MNLKKFKFPKRRRRRKNAEKSVGYKCLLLGPNNASRESFLDDLNTMDGGPREGINECVLKVDNSDCVFWKVDSKCEKNKSCIKQYLDFHNPDIIFYFIDMIGDDLAETELLIQRLEALGEVLQEDQNFCIVFDKQYADFIIDLNLDLELFKENVMKIIKQRIDFQFEYCFSNIEEIIHVLSNLTIAASSATPTDDVDIEDLTLEEGSAWDEFCDIGGGEEYFLAPLPVTREALVRQDDSRNYLAEDFTEEEDNGSWMGKAGMNVVESF